MIGQVLSKRVQHTANLLVKVPARTMYPQQSSNVISGMPRNRIPFPEKVATALFLGFCVLATPAYIVTHMNDYRTLEPK